MARPDEVKPFRELQFTGGRFDEVEGFLDLDVLQELDTYRRILVETAIDLWRQSHPGQPDLPPGFRANFRLGIGAISTDSCKVILDRRLGSPELASSSNGKDELDSAAALVDAALLAVEDDAPFPKDVSSRVLQMFKPWGKSLGREESMVLSGEKDRIPVLSYSVRTKLAHRLAKQVSEPGSGGLLDLYGKWEGLEITEEDISQSKLTFRDIKF